MPWCRPCQFLRSTWSRQQHSAVSALKLHTISSPDYPLLLLRKCFSRLSTPVIPTPTLAYALRTFLTFHFTPDCYGLCFHAERPLRQFHTTPSHGITPRAESFPLSCNRRIHILSSEAGIFVTSYTFISQGRYTNGDRTRLETAPLARRLGPLPHSPPAHTRHAFSWFSLLTAPAVFYSAFGRRGTLVRQLLFLAWQALTVASTPRRHARLVGHPPQQFAPIGCFARRPFSTSAGASLHQPHYSRSPRADTHALLFLPCYLHLSTRLLAFIFCPAFGVVASVRQLGALGAICSLLARFSQLCTILLSCRSPPWGSELPPLTLLTLFIYAASRTPRLSPLSQHT